jgi:hypothetical protein
VQLSRRARRIQIGLLCLALGLAVTREQRPLATRWLVAATGVALGLLGLATVATATLRPSSNPWSATTGARTTTE